MNIHIIIALSIITLSGLLGGYANFHRGENNKKFDPFKLRQSLLIGLVASFTVPLFLQMVSSQLLEEARNHNEEWKYLVFAGFCLIAAFYSQRFLSSIASRVISDLQEKTDNIEKLTHQNNEAVQEMMEHNSRPAGLVKSQDERWADLPQTDFKSRALEYFKKNKYKFVSDHVILEDTGMSTEQLAPLIRDLENDNLIKKFEGKGGKQLYAITDKGKNH